MIRRVIGYPSVLGIAVLALWLVSIRMPGRSHEGPLPPLTAAEDSSRARLAAHVRMLAGTIGERHQARMRALDSAANYVDETLRALGYATATSTYVVASRTYRNIEATITGTTAPTEIVLVGAHYDSVEGSPGADDNASGVACLLELARLLRERAPARSVRFVAFANEEPPWFWGDDMGSLRYARMARARNDDIVAMLSLETLGYYSDAAGSQKYPAFLGWFYPDRGDFIGFVGNVGSRGLVHRALADFRSHTQFPTQGSAAPRQIPGIGWSDQWSFSKVGYDGIMITDTAPHRNGNYHMESDTPETLDYARMARVVHGIGRTVEELARR